MLLQCKDVIYFLSFFFKYKKCLLFPKMMKTSLCASFRPFSNIYFLCHVVICVFWPSSLLKRNFSNFKSRCVSDKKFWKCTSRSRQLAAWRRLQRHPTGQLQLSKEVHLKCLFYATDYGLIFIQSVWQHYRKDPKPKLMIAGTVERWTKMFLVGFSLFLSSLNEVCFAIKKLLTLQMESGGFGKSDIVAVSG